MRPWLDLVGEVNSVIKKADLITSESNFFLRCEVSFYVGVVRPLPLAYRDSEVQRHTLFGYCVGVPRSLCSRHIQHARHTQFYAPTLASKKDFGLCPALILRHF